MITSFLLWALALQLFHGVNAWNEKWIRRVTVVGRDSRHWLTFSPTTEMATDDEITRLRRIIGSHSDDEQGWEEAW